MYTKRVHFLIVSFFQEICTFNDCVFLGYYGICETTFSASHQRLNDASNRAHQAAEEREKESNPPLSDPNIQQANVQH